MKVEMDIYRNDIDDDDRTYYICYSCGDMTERVERIIDGMVK
jgi:hypothetical protein